MALTLADELIRFMESGISLCAASRDKRLLPSLARVLACRVGRQQGRVRLLLASSQSEQLLRDCLATDRIALVMSDPPTHRTWQLKGDGVQILAVTQGDRQCIERHGAEFALTIGTLGFSPAFASALFAHPAGEVVALGFTPQQLFDQTPGPRAGEKIAGQA